MSGPACIQPAVGITERPAYLVPLPGQGSNIDTSTQPAATFGATTPRDMLCGHRRALRRHPKEASEGLATMRGCCKCSGVGSLPGNA